VCVCDARYVTLSMIVAAVSLLFNAVTHASREEHHADTERVSP